MQRLVQVSDQMDYELEGLCLSVFVGVRVFQNGKELLRLAGPCNYKAGISKAAISVRIGAHFTVIQVNDLEIYFSRLTGKMDGVVFCLASCCTPTQTGVPVRPDEQRTDQQELAHM